jgi:bifunctional non-homologous end joining protein LigD
MLWRPYPSPKRPGLIEPCIPTLASRPPVGPQWLHEIKHDGYRLIARKTVGRVRLFTRRGYDWTDRYPLIAKAVTALRANPATIDGEAVHCDANGVSIFEKLQSRRHDDRIMLYAFDLLELDGEDFRPNPLHAVRRSSKGYSSRRRPVSNTTSTSRATVRSFSTTPAA